MDEKAQGRGGGQEAGEARGEEMHDDLESGQDTELSELGFSGLRSPHCPEQGSSWRPKGFSPGTSTRGHFRTPKFDIQNMRKHREQKRRPQSGTEGAWCSRRDSELDSHGQEWPWDSGMHWSDGSFVFIHLVPTGKVGRCGAGGAAPRRKVKRMTST